MTSGVAETASVMPQTDNDHELVIRPRGFELERRVVDRVVDAGERRPLFDRAAAKWVARLGVERRVGLEANRVMAVKTGRSRRRVPKTVSATMSGRPNQAR